jgi:hypothetical protein
MLFSSNKNLSLNLLLTTTVAFTGNVLAKAQDCISFRYSHEDYTVKAPNARYKSDILDTVWNYLIDRCGVEEIDFGCDKELANHTNYGSGDIGGSWCDVGYSHKAPRFCIEDAFVEGCNLGFGTNTDIGVVSGIVGAVAVLAVGAGLYIIARETRLRSHRAAVRARANDADAPEVAVPAIPVVIQLANLNPQAQARPARPAREDLGNGPEGRPRRARRNGRRADRQHRHAADQQYQLVAPAAAPEPALQAGALRVIVERSEIAEQPGARRGSFSLSSNAHSMWNSAIQPSAANAAPEPGARVNTP